VVVEVDRERVTVLDPLVGERSLPQEAFQAAWAAMRFLTLVIAT
jgi:predicted double-glycine peptidase